MTEDEQNGCAILIALFIVIPCFIVAFGFFFRLGYEAFK